MDNYMKDFYEGQIKTSKTKIKLMEAGLKAILSNPDNIEVEGLGSFVNAINNEKTSLINAEKNLEEHISGVAKRKQEARIKLGIVGVAHE